MEDRDPPPPPPPTPCSCIHVHHEGLREAAAPESSSMGPFYWRGCGATWRTGGRDVEERVNKQLNLSRKDENFFKFMSVTHFTETFFLVLFVRQQPRPRTHITSFSA